ncbi:MAG: hypothetical protein IPK33_04740 [Gemmatimonadetes bacterium]|nr:hypothetical protein [Gemmatimonadota bacterium]
MTILVQTRYWRSFRLPNWRRRRWPHSAEAARRIVARLHAAGYAVIAAMTCGTGVGREWPWPWSAGKWGQQRTIIDWIVAQPSVNGAVGATGCVSYGGHRTLLAARWALPALGNDPRRADQTGSWSTGTLAGEMRNIAFGDMPGPRQMHDLDRHLLRNVSVVRPVGYPWCAASRRRSRRVALRALQGGAPASSVAQRARGGPSGARSF